MEWRIEEIVIDQNAGKDLQSSEFLAEVAVLRINSKLTSTALRVLSDRLPLEGSQLTHLKRVRKASSKSPDVEIVLGPAKDVLLIEHNFWEQFGVKVETEILDHEGCVLEMVPRYEPANRQEFTAWCQFWPINFHPGEMERCRARGLEKDEIAYIESMANQLLKQQEQSPSSTASVAILCNPVSSQAICSSSSARERLHESMGSADALDRHPLYTPTLLALDELSAIARKEVPGIERLPAGHYLATGLDLFLTTEPNLFSAMALVHSRIRHVYYLHPDPVHGALQSGNGHIHQLRALNHHYRAFRLVPSSS